MNLPICVIQSVGTYRMIKLVHRYYTTAKKDDFSWSDSAIKVACIQENV